jgi:hypothetical protein
MVNDWQFAIESPLIQGLNRVIFLPTAQKQRLFKQIDRTP